MSNQLYAKGRQRFLIKEINWLADPIMAVMLRQGFYTPDLLADEFLADIPVSARMATAGPLTGKTAFDGVADAADTPGVFSVPGVIISAVALYLETGNAATAPLIAYLDNVLNLPFAAAEQDFRLVWSNGPDRLFRL